MTRTSASSASAATGMRRAFSLNPLSRTHALVSTSSNGGRCTPRENAINIIPFLLPVRAFRSCKKPPQYAHGAMAGAGIH